MNPLLRVGLFVFCLPVFADYQAGLDAYQRGDYATAMSEWKAVVRQEPEAERLAIYRESLYGIAMLYWQGEGVERDYSVSAVWLKQAADINHPGAQTKLGYLYSTGQGVPQNDAEAVRWFEMAAQQGDADAQYNLDLLGHEASVEPVPAARSDLDADEQWILAQDPEHYTIQVIALSAPDKLHDFIDGQPDWAPFAIYRQSRYKKPLWVMVQGSYANVDAARDAAGKFPPGIQKRQDLWIRKFGMVQRLIE